MKRLVTGLLVFAVTAMSGAAQGTMERVVIRPAATKEVRVAVAQPVKGAPVHKQAARIRIVGQSNKIILRPGQQPVLAVVGNANNRKELRATPEL